MNTDRCHTLLDRLIAPVATAVARAPEDAALPILYAATVPDLEGGTFVGPRTEFRGPMRVTRLPVRHPADDRDLAERLWAVSEELTGTRSMVLSRT